MKHEFTIIFEHGENGWWIASALEMEGAFSQGKTIEEARLNVMDAIRQLMLAQCDLAEEELRDRTDIVRETVSLEL
jgi:predicted RNase H-like HicB family nuclease